MPAWLDKLKGALARKPKAPAGAWGQLHAIRWIQDGPEPHDGRPRVWYAIEVTVSPDPVVGATWWPTELVLASPADPDPWGLVHTPRVWNGEQWIDPGDEALEGEHRLRLLYAVWPDPPAELEIIAWETALCRVDLGRADVVG